MSKTIFITGASSGLGKAAAKLFQGKGWNVAATIRMECRGNNEEAGKRNGFERDREYQIL